MTLYETYLITIDHLQFRRWNYRYRSVHGSSFSMTKLEDGRFLKWLPKNHYSKKTKSSKNSTKYRIPLSQEIYEIWSNFEREREKDRSMSNVEKCSAAAQEEGVTRIPGAAVHVGLIDSQRRRARVTRHQLQCCTHARARVFEWANTKADFASSFHSKIRNVGGGGGGNSRVAVIFFFLLIVHRISDPTYYSSCKMNF